MSDLIKREDAIKELADYMYYVALLKADGRLNTTKHYLNLAEKRLKHIPSADRPSIDEQAEEVLSKIYDAVNGINALLDRPQGEWERVSADKYVQHAYHFYRCSKCGYDHIDKTNFCPNCGSRMRGDKND